ncbi:three-helix bundle dimerization domain-containing protein [Lentzea sp. NPDC059081]|uniref:three-helix bundle dimerization domain-containing protein n=1 Tax=Lentzea sp. NPDC059081 TaxID=3346719 RepID=UPI0036CF05AB
MAVVPGMLNSEAQVRQAVEDLTRRFGDRVAGDEIREAAEAAHEGLSRTATVTAHLAVLTARRAARDLAFAAIGVRMPVQQTAWLTPPQVTSK